MCLKSDGIDGFDHHARGKTRLPELRSQAELDRRSKAACRFAVRNWAWSILVALCLLPVPAFADDVCMPAAELEAALIDWYGEAPRAEGPAGTVLWVTSDGASWTLVRYEADGTACSIDHGVGEAEGAEAFAYATDPAIRR
jgi:hypothetical protein